MEYLVPVLVLVGDEGVCFQGLLPGFDVCIEHITRNNVLIMSRLYGLTGNSRYRRKAVIVKTILETDQDVSYVVANQTPF